MQFSKSLITPFWECVVGGIQKTVSVFTGGREEITGRIPMGRWVDPMDLAGTPVLLDSDASGYITGQTIFVDGGWLSN